MFRSSLLCSASFFGRAAVRKTALHFCWPTLTGVALLVSPAFAQTHGEVETVVSSASPLSGTTAAISDHVDAGAILRGGGANLADALRSIPGVSGAGMAVGAN